MRIGIDAREAFHEEKTGKGMWTYHVIQELSKRDSTLTLFVEEGQKVPDAFSHWSLSRALPRGISAFPRGLRWHFAVAKHLRKEKNCDLYLSPTSYLVPRILGKKFPCGIVVHDLIAFESEPHDAKAKILERLTLPKVLQTAIHIFSVSEATKRELLVRFPRTKQEKITVVYEGPTTRNWELGIRNQESLNSYFLIPHSPYILCVGTLCPRKNQLRLIEAFNLLPEDLRKKTKLILVGKRGWDDEEIVRLAKQSPNVEWKGYVEDTEREKLLREATLFAYPSLAEGFGLPVLDALSLGIPTLTSRRSSLPEVAGDAAFLVDPKNTEEIADALQRLLTNEVLRKELSEKGRRQGEKFTWERTVDALLEKVR
jgi:glycosyltransferase involved in cell wall biosynthesis